MEVNAVNKKILTFECPVNLVRELEKICATTQVSKSELIREGINHVISHYNMEATDDTQSVTDLIKRALFILEQNKN